MKNLMGAALTLAIGMGLAATAQAQGTYSQTNQPPGNVSGAPSAAMPNEPSGAAMQNGSMGADARAAAPMRTRHRLAAGGRMSRNEIQEAQQQLKQQGLYRGRIDGKMGRGTRAALSQFQQQNGLQQTGRLDQQTLAGLMSGQTSGVGSSAPSAAPGMRDNGAGMTPSANPNPNAAGDNNNPTGPTTPPSPSTGTNPSGSHSKY